MCAAAWLGSSSRTWRYNPIDSSWPLGSSSRENRWGCTARSRSVMKGAGIDVRGGVVGLEFEDLAVQPHRFFLAIGVLFQGESMGLYRQVPICNEGGRD